MSNIASVFTGKNHTLAIDNDGVLWGWGWAFDNRVFYGGIDAEELVFSPARVMDDVIATAAGERHSLAVTSDGTLWGWGSNDTGQINDSDTFIYRYPVEIMTGVIAVAAGRKCSMALTADGTLWVWGQHSGDEFGRKVRVMDDLVSIYAGLGEYGSTGSRFAITGDGILWGWGIAIEDNPALEYRPLQLMSDVVAVSAAGNHIMVITSDGALWGWGYNNTGQLGDGTTTRHSSPIHIMDNVVAVSAGVGHIAGVGHTVATTADGGVWAWGLNLWGQVGDGTNNDRRSPVLLNAER